MSRWITFDYRCNDCESVTTELMERSDVKDIIECACGGRSSKQLTANITRVSYVDGNDRWRYVKEKRALDKLAREARKSGDSDQAAYIRQEIDTVKQASKTDSKAANICKVSPKEK